MPTENKLDDRAEEMFKAMNVEVTEQLTDIYFRVKQIKDRVSPGPLTASEFAIVAVMASLDPSCDEAAEKPSIVEKVVDKAVDVVKTVKDVAGKVVDAAGDGDGKIELDDVIAVGRKVYTTINGEYALATVLEMVGSKLTLEVEGDSRPSREVDMAKQDVELAKE